MDAYARSFLLSVGMRDNDIAFIVLLYFMVNFLSKDEHKRKIVLNMMFILNDMQNMEQSIGWYSQWFAEDAEVGEYIIRRNTFLGT